MGVRWACPCHVRPLNLDRCFCGRGMGVKGEGMAAGYTLCVKVR